MLAALLKLFKQIPEYLDKLEKLIAEARAVLAALEAAKGGK